MVLFIFEFILTNIIFSLIICGMFLYFDRENNYTGLEILLYSLGTGPVFTTLILYYLILLFPKHSNFFYFFIVISFFPIIFRNTPTSREVPIVRVLSNHGSRLTLFI